MGEAPDDEEFRRRTESNREIIEQIEASSAQSQLPDAVGGLVELAGSFSTARFTRVLVWLIAEFSSGRCGDPTPGAPTLDPRAAQLVRRAGVCRAAGTDGVLRAADLALMSRRAVLPDAPQRARLARLQAYLLLQWEFLTDEPADFSEVERPTPDPDDDSADRLADWSTNIPGAHRTESIDRGRGPKRPLRVVVSYTDRHGRHPAQTGPTTATELSSDRSWPRQPEVGNGSCSASATARSPAEFTNASEPRANATSRPSSPLPGAVSTSTGPSSATDGPTNWRHPPHLRLDRPHWESLGLFWFTSRRGAHD